MYAQTARQLASLLQQVNPAVKLALGAVPGLNLGAGTTANWTADLLALCATYGVTPTFLSDQVFYNGGPQTETDAGLLAASTDPTATGDGTRGPTAWAGRASYYASAIATGLPGLLGAQTMLLANFNCRFSAPSPQSTSLVNGLYLADTLGVLATQPRYQAALAWSWMGKGGSDSVAGAGGIYGWRNFGDLGLVSYSGSPPGKGLGVPYPSFFAYKLFNQLMNGGAVMLGTSIDTASLTAYGAWCGFPPGELRLLLVNKSSSQSVTPSVFVPGFRAASTATLVQYGPTQDTAQQNSSDGKTGIDLSTSTLAYAGTVTIPAYTMALLRIPPQLG
jgi:hypothetical protein